MGVGVATPQGCVPCSRRAPIRAPSRAPRGALLMPTDAAVVATCLGGDEASAVAAAEEKGEVVDTSSKRALARWIRRNAITAEWAGAHIPLNALAPGMVNTPLTEAIRNNPIQRRKLDQAMPMPSGFIPSAQTIPTVARRSPRSPSA